MSECICVLYSDTNIRLAVTALTGRTPTHPIVIFLRSIMLYPLIRQRFLPSEKFWVGKLGGVKIKDGGR